MSVEVDKCPIMSLPDDMLCQIIFSLITDIPFKMQLESVCKRFQRISTTQTSSWKRNDRLELVGGSKTGTLYDPLMKYLAGSTKYPPSAYLNGREMSVNKWAKAIDQLLQRAVVHKLCIHINFLSEDQLPHLRQVLEVLQNRPSRVRLTYIELVAEGCQEFSERLYLWALSHSAQTLESIVLLLSLGETLDFVLDERWTQFCTGVAACLNLKSLAIRIPYIATSKGRHIWMQLSDALQGKPLNSITIGGGQSFGDPVLTGFLLAVCQNATGGGITSLKVARAGEPPADGLSDFCNALHPPTAQSLVELWIASPVITHMIDDLNHLPALFPQLKELHLVKLDDSHFARELRDQPYVNEIALHNTRFFTICDETPLVDRRVLISLLRIDEEAGFVDDVDLVCEELGVNAVYGEGQQQNWLTLNKGRGTIVIEKIEPTAADDLLLLKDLLFSM